MSKGQPKWTPLKYFFPEIIRRSMWTLASEKNTPAESIKRLTRFKKASLPELLLGAGNTATLGRKSLLTGKIPANKHSSILVNNWNGFVIIL